MTTAAVVACVLIAGSIWDEASAQRGAATVTKQRYGNADRYSDTGTVTTSGSRRTASDGTTYTTVGNRVFGSDGSVETTYGPRTITTGPGMGTTIGTKSGDSTYYTGGTYGTARTSSTTTFYDLYYLNTNAAQAAPQAGSLNWSGAAGAYSRPGGASKTTNATTVVTPAQPSQGVVDLYRMGGDQR